MNSNLHFTANMHRGNFAWLFLVILVSDGLQLMICVPGKLLSSKITLICLILAVCISCFSFILKRIPLHLLQWTQMKTKRTIQKRAPCRLPGSMKRYVLARRLMKAKSFFNHMQHNVVLEERTDFRWTVREQEPLCPSVKDQLISICLKIKTKV